MADQADAITNDKPAKFVDKDSPEKGKYYPVSLKKDDVIEDGTKLFKISMAGGRTYI